MLYHHLLTSESPSWTSCKSSISRLRKCLSVVVMGECPKCGSTKRKEPNPQPESSANHRSGLSDSLYPNRFLGPGQHRKNLQEEYPQDFTNHDTNSHLARHLFSLILMPVHRVLHCIK